MDRDKIYARNHLVGSGQMYHPDRIEELEELRAKHERLTRGKPSKPFSELLEEKMKRLRGDAVEEEKDPPQKGAIDPYLGLAPKQTAIANRAQGRRSAKVIVKG